MTTKLSNEAGMRKENWRKAAILVASLDTAAADAVLDELTPEQARQVREIVVELEDIDQSEQRRVIDEFFHNGPAAPGQDTAGVELDGRLAWLARSEVRGQRSEAETPTSDLRPLTSDLRHLTSDLRPLTSDFPPFRFLQDAEVEKLVRAIAHERPQTIALVLSHLAPARAGDVLARLPENVQVEVVRRLVDLEETDPAILREVEEALRGRLTEQVASQRRRVAGLQTVAGILKATDGRMGIRILDNLAKGDRTLADKLQPPQLAFDDLAEMDTDVLGEALDEAGPELMLPALLGAAPKLVDRILACLPATDAHALRHRLESPGPIRLRDVEEARRQIARIASRVNYQVKT